MIGGLLAAWATGVLGSTHCVAMCGGVVAVSCTSIPLRRRSSPALQLPYLLAYNAGRIASYSLAGLAAGSLGAAFTSLAWVAHAELGLRLFAACLMLLVGLYVTGWRAGLGMLERLGSPLWRRIAPMAQRCLPLRSPVNAFGLGLLWGWMPCGLVYAALAMAVGSGSALGGALTMAAFGLGTLPMLLVMGSATALVSKATRTRWVRAAAGTTIVLLGCVHAVGVAQAWARSPAEGMPPSCPLHHAAARARAPI